MDSELALTSDFLTIKDDSTGAHTVLQWVELRHVMLDCSVILQFVECGLVILCVCWGQALMTQGSCGIWGLLLDAVPGCMGG